MSNESCRQVRRKLESLVDGLLSRPESAAIERHLDACPVCRTAAALEQRLKRELEALPRLPCPQRVSDALLDAVKEGEKPRLRRTAWKALFPSWTWKPALAGGAVLIVALCLSHRFRETAPPPPVYTEEEVLRAREIVKWSLAYSAQQVQESERSVFREVLNRRLPETVEQAVRAVYKQTTGESP